MAKREDKPDRRRRKRPAEDAAKVQSVLPLSQPAARLEEIRALCQSMLDKPDPAVARKLEFEAGEVEAFFASIRHRAQQFVRARMAEENGATERGRALAELRKIVVPASPPEAAPARPEERREVEESLLFREPAVQTLLTPEIEPKEKEEGKQDSTETGKLGEFNLADFFRDVSGAVIEAQRQLDRYSLQYARQQVASPIPPALYSIPTVHAEVKAALSQQDGAGILVRLFRDEEQSNFTESTISFDVVSSPAPPGKLSGFTSPVPPFLAVDGPDRERVVAALSQSSGHAPLEEGWEERTLVFRNLDPNPIRNPALLVFVFGKMPAASKGQATDFSLVSWAVYEVGDDQLPKAIDVSKVPGLMRQRMVCLMYGIAEWVKSITVPQ